MILNGEKTGELVIQKTMTKLKIVTMITEQKINEYVEKRRETDVTFRLIHNTRRKILHVLGGDIKPSSTLDILWKDFESRENE